MERRHSIRFKVWSLTKKMYVGLTEHHVTNWPFHTQLQAQYDQVMCLSTEIKDSAGITIFENDIVYLAGLGDTAMVFPFIALYEAQAELDVGKIKGNIFEPK